MKQYKCRQIWMASLDIKESKFVRVYDECAGQYTLKAICNETVQEVALDDSTPQLLPKHLSPKIARLLLPKNWA